MSKSTADPCRDRQRVQPYLHAGFVSLLTALSLFTFIRTPYLPINETGKDGYYPFTTYNRSQLDQAHACHADTACLPSVIVLVS
jgi:hypothetical protein